MKLTSPLVRRAALWSVAGFFVLAPGAIFVGAAHGANYKPDGDLAA